MLMTRCSCFGFMTFILAHAALAAPQQCPSVDTVKQQVLITNVREYGRGRDYASYEAQWRPIIDNNGSKWYFLLQFYTAPQNNGLNVANQIKNSLIGAPVPFMQSETGEWYCIYGSPFLKGLAAVIAY